MIYVLHSESYHCSLGDEIEQKRFCRFQNELITQQHSTAAYLAHEKESAENFSPRKVRRQEKTQEDEKYKINVLFFFSYLKGQDKYAAGASEKKGKYSSNHSVYPRIRRT